MNTKTNLINQIENSEVSEAQAQAILEILNAGETKETFDLGITQEMQERRTAQSETFTGTNDFAKLQANVIQARMEIRN